MSRKGRLAAFGEQVGFDVEVESDIVRAVRVPCLLVGGVPATCNIETSFDPETCNPDQRVGGDVHAVRIATDEECDGRVYHADGTPIGNYVGGDGRTWSNISIKKVVHGKPEPDKTAYDLIHRYAKHIVGALSAAGYSEPASLTLRDPFNVPNTFEARAAIAPVQDQIRGQRIAIVGLGGTGAYIFDLASKTPVREIHVLDDDYMEWHNFMRAPGAPTAKEIELLHMTCLRKVDYYGPKYTCLREGVFLHAVRVDSEPRFERWLSDHHIDFAFVCVDQLTEGDTARQDIVYSALTKAKVPFIDSGVSMTVEHNAVSGSATTSFYEAGSVEWQEAIPNAKVTGDVPGYRNVQLPEVNALAAALAVMEWRRRTGQYVSNSASFLHKFRLEKPNIVVPT